LHSLSPRPSRIAVVVPTHRLDLQPDERVSLAHLAAHLGRYETFLVVPEGVSGTIDGLLTQHFDRRFFASHRAYNRLLLSSVFYSAFLRWDYVLVYHLDSLVFRDDLEEWCNRGYDYVGAPWTRRDADGKPYFTGVGNGGLSLRRVATCLRAVEALRRPGPALRVRLQRAAAVTRRATVSLPRGASAVLATARARYIFEDKFFGLTASTLVRDFRVAPVSAALEFAFETEPRFCFAANGARLPTGCHRWAAHDPEFWQPYVLPPGDER
jgi:hypothetical protein